jgi:shikimate kinase
VTGSHSIEGRPIFLIGFMGAGKSTVGRLLAARLERAFVDADERIESEAGATVAEIFAAEGEAGFRARERDVLRRLADGGAQVVAVGGGAPAHGDNLDRMLASGVVVLLDANVDEILERVGDGAGRPLLQAAPDAAARRAVVEKLYAARAPFYARAHVRLDTNGRPPSKIVAALVEALAC